MCKKKFRRALLALGVILLLSVMWIYRPYASFDPEAVSKNLSGLEEPFERVEGSYFMDGGSVGIRIVDAQGRQADFCLRADQMDGDQKYERLYFGSLHYAENPSSEIPEPSDTIIRLLEILRTADGVDRERDIAVAAASGRWRDFSRVIWRRLGSSEY